MPILIQHITQDQAPLVVASPGDSLQDAVPLMIEHDFSQLPVVENGVPYGRPASFVTSTSIARALRVFGASLDHLRVRDAVTPAPVVAMDDDVFARMGDLLGSAAVLVLDADNKLAGIVTSHDTTQYFRRRAEDMLLVEDIETTLKDHIRSALSGDDEGVDGPLGAAVSRLGTPTDSIRDACRRSFRKFCGIQGMKVTDAEVAEYIDQPFAGRGPNRTFDDLTLNDYIQLACSDEAWTRLEGMFGIPREAFRAMLEGVRKTRNKLMHFRPNVDALERDRLRFCSQWFKNHPVPYAERLSVDRESSIDESSGEPAAQSEDSGTAAGLEGYAAGEFDQSKYAPLARFLAEQPRSLDRLALGFDEVERIIGAALPGAAREHRAWWSNDTAAHVQSVQWLDVNWRVVSINMTDERVVFARARDRERAYITFFSTVQNRLREVGTLPVAGANPSGQNWLPLASFSRKGLTLVSSFARRRRLRLECYIDTGDAAENESLYDALYRSREALESAIGTPLTWERLENRRACRVAAYTAGSITDDPGDLERNAEWVVAHAPRMYRALADVISASL